MVDCEGYRGGGEVVKLSYSPAFGPVSCKVSRVGEMFIKGVRNVFIGGDDVVVEVY